MPQYLSPGVYVEEMEAGTRPIEGVLNDTLAEHAGFVRRR
jgi:phage tail sheath protein FI